MMNGPDSIETAAAAPVAPGVVDSAPPRRGWRVFRIAAFILAASAFAFLGGFGWFADHVSHLRPPADPQKADAIIVLTGGQSAASRRQLQRATGGDKQLFSCCVDIDHAALDTIGNAEESAKWVASHAYGSIILVTNNYHMPRSLLEMGRLLHGARLEPYPVVNSNLGNGGWLTKPEALRVLFTEYNKYLLALARGVLPVRPLPGGIALAEAATKKN